MSRLPSQKERCVYERGEHCKELEYEHLDCETPFSGSMGMLILCKQKKKAVYVLYYEKKKGLQSKCLIIKATSPPCSTDLFHSASWLLYN